MFHKLSAAILTACICIIVTGTPPTGATSSPSTQSQALDPDMMGMVIRDPWYEFGTYPGLPDEPNRVSQERMGQILEEAGVRWVRLEFFVEGDDAAALDRTFARYDYFINEVAPRHGLQVLGLLGFGVVKEVAEPLNTTDGIGAGPFTTDSIYGGGVNPYMQRWLGRALGIATHYQGTVAAYEVLNEQNRLTAKGQGVPASLAARLHTKFYRLLKHPQPADGAPWRDNVQVIVGGLHPKGTLDQGQTGYLSDTDYLRQIYGYSLETSTSPSAPVTGEPFQEYLKTYGAYPLDGLGYHPYPEEIRLSLQADSDLINDRLTSIRSVLAEVQDPARRYWITEIGYNTAFKQQNDADQAAFLRAVYTAMAARGDVVRIFWFKYEDFPPADNPGAQRWGMVRIPFTISTECPGGACYDINGEPSTRRLAFLVYRELAGLPVYHIHLPIVMR
ncbi:hypothetical protein EKD04_014190 [Chloroflexales bacterium ZM16-3]|nr:hypothetical protein [Chloroflexales bacterium ZM16-3]